ncbi:MAG: HTH-type transcriptional activator IlvY [Alkalispirochaetaceae bacterium]
METRDLELFCDLAETVSFARTSERRHISPSGLSRAIQRLEGELGVRLFLRDNRRVALTGAGRRFLPTAGSTLRALTEAKEELGSELSGGVRGVLELYASVTACYAVLPPLLEAFRREHPEAQIHLRTGDAARAVAEVREESSQVAVAAIPPRLDRNLLAQRITTTPLRFVAPTGEGPVARMARRSPLPWPELPLILPDAGLAREQVDRWLRRRAIRPNIYAEVSGNEAILAMVGLELGVGVVPELVIAKSPVRAALATLDPGPELEPYQVGVVARRRSLQLPVVRAFWRMVERVASSPHAASMS